MLTYKRAALCLCGSVICRLITRKTNMWRHPLHVPALSSSDSGTWEEGYSGEEDCHHDEKSTPTLAVIKWGCNGDPIPFRV